VPLTTLFLDAGGVLVTPNWQRVSAALGAHGVSVAAAALQAADPFARRDIDFGHQPAATDRQRGWAYFNLVLEHCGIAQSAATDLALDDLQAYHSTHNLWETVPDGVAGVLDHLRAMSVKLVVVSNANGKLKVLLARLDLARRFDLMLDSHEEGVEKPDPRFFEIALERSGAERGETLHVGDLYRVDVQGARSAGLDAVLLDPAGLYAGFDCRRIRALGELPAIVAESREPRALPAFARSASAGSP
jgi:putative hydrolase of the HAD superfamily